MSEIITSTMSLKDSGGDNYYTKLTSADIGADKNFTLTSPILQILSTTLTGISTSFSIGVNSNGEAPATAMTGLTVTITPTSTSSKIFVFGQMSASLSSDNDIRIAITRGGSIINSGSTGTNRSPCHSTHDQRSANHLSCITFQYLDSPASTSALEYGLNANHNSGSTRTLRINQEGSDNNSSYYLSLIHI